MELTAAQLTNILRHAIMAQVQAGFLVEGHALLGAIASFKREAEASIPVAPLFEWNDTKPESVATP